MYQDTEYLQALDSQTSCQVILFHFIHLFFSFFLLFKGHQTQKLKDLGPVLICISLICLIEGWT